MIVLLTATLIGGLIALIALWPHGALVALVAAPFCGSLSALIAGLFLAYLRTRAKPERGPDPCESTAADNCPSL